MTRPFGIAGKLEPEYAFVGLSEEILTQDNIVVSIENGSIQAGFDAQSDLEKAKALIQRVLDAWSVRHHIRATASLDHTWEPGPQAGVAHQVSLQATARIIPSVTTHHISHSTDTILRHEVSSYSFKHSQDLALKSLHDEPLAQALRYMNDEVIDDNKPLYGVYKAIETLRTALNPDGARKLAVLAGEHEKYVKDVLETAQQTRHSNSRTRVHFGEQECIARAKVLIEAYADQVTI